MPDWRRFWIVLLAAAGGVLGGAYLAVVIVDPYDTLFLSPPFNRAPVVTNQRFSYPALARKARFDSAVIGTSTARLLKPAQLNPLFGAAFVNLAMNSSTAYEQSRILDLFAGGHPRARVVIFAIDTVWCGIGESYPKFTFRPFPPWLYDENRWNDLLHLLNLKTMEQMGLQFAYLTGIHPAPRRGLDGYTAFLPPRSQYRLAQSRTNIYGGPEPKTRAPVVPSETPSAAERAGWRFPTHQLFPSMLARLPAATIKIVLFVPYHAYLLPAEGSRGAAVWRECKRRFVRMAGAAENGHVLDFMIRSEITERDENYWDGLHYSRRVAARVGELIAAGAAQRTGRRGLFDYLTPGDFD